MESPPGLRLAATVMVLRDAPGGLEVFMLRRSARSPFAPDAFVFPGGAVDPRDLDIDRSRRILGLTLQTLENEFRAQIPPQLPADAPAEIGAETGAALIRAALREVFEEAGLLPARDACGNRIAGSIVRAYEVQSLREGIRDGSLDFDTFLETRDWFADANDLALFSHWITPPGEGRRYNTYFFMLRAPDDQMGSADRFETHDERWIAPASALDEYRAGRMHLVYPTIKHLERIARFGSADDAIAFARNKPIITIQPTTPPELGFTMPHDLEGAW